MTKNRRYAARYDELNDLKFAIEAAELTPTTLPLPAYGSESIDWAPREAQPTVWAWLSWRDAPASKITALAGGTTASWSSSGSSPVGDHPLSCGATL